MARAPSSRLDCSWLSAANVEVARGLGLGPVWGDFSVDDGLGTDNPGEGPAVVEQLVVTRRLPPNRSAPKQIIHSLLGGGVCTPLSSRPPGGSLWACAGSHTDGAASYSCERRPINRSISGFRKLKPNHIKSASSMRKRKGSPLRDLTASGELSDSLARGDGRASCRCHCMGARLRREVSGRESSVPVLSQLLLTASGASLHHRQTLIL